jgi:branched-chain amino acid transport system substrate-binding protein
MCSVRRVLLPWFIFLALGGCKPRAEPEAIWIGHVAPFSGPDERIGEHGRQAILLAVEKANKEENGIAGRRVAVLHVDSHGDLNALQPEAVRLITVNRVMALLGGVNAVEVERLGRAVQPYEVALVTPAAVPADRLAENVFSVNASLSFQGQVLARFAARELKAERVAVLSDGRRPSDMALAEAFHKEFASPGGYALQQHVYKSDADLARAALESKDAKPQAILYAGAAADLAKARATLQGAGLTVPLLFGGDGEHLAALEADPNASNGIFVATPFSLEGGTPDIRDFFKKYQERFHQAPGADGLLAYDGVRVLFQSMRKAGFISAPKVVLAGLARFSNDNFDSLTGPIVFNKDHSARRPLFVVRLENGKMQDPVRFDPEAK